MKRGEISMEVIIIAAIALLVLVILSLLVIRQGGLVAKDCANIGGTCQDAASCTGEGKIPGTASSCGDGQVCCLPVKTTQAQ